MSRQRIVQQHMPELLDPKTELYPLLGHIYPEPRDMDILKVWTDHLISKNQPFMVVEVNNDEKGNEVKRYAKKFVLYKNREVDRYGRPFWRRQEKVQPLQQDGAQRQEA